MRKKAKPANHMILLITCIIIVLSCSYIIYKKGSSEEILSESAEINYSSSFDEFSKFMVNSLDLSESLSIWNLGYFEESENFMIDFNEDYKEFITINSIEYGSFSGSGKEEAFVVFSPTDCCHAEGFDRKVVALFDMESDELLFQHSFGADSVSIDIITTYSCDHSFLLFTGAFINSGIPSGNQEFFSIENGVLTEMPLPSVETDLRKLYSYDETNKKLMLRLYAIFTDETDGFAYAQADREFFYSFNSSTLTFEEVQ